MGARIFALLRELEDDGGRLVLAAQAPPALLPWALPDLGSRCAAGAVLQLRVLDETEQQAALKLRARVRGFELPDETLQWLQRRFPRDMRASMNCSIRSMRRRSWRSAGSPCPSSARC